MACRRCWIAPFRCWRRSKATAWARAWRSPVAAILRVAGEGARFGAPIARLGFPMAPREAQLVAREVGVAVARAMLLEAAVF